MFSNEGIDKIAVAINPWFLNTKYYYSREMRPKYISTKVKGYNYPVVFIQNETLSMDDNIADQVIFILLPFLNPLLVLFKQKEENEIELIKRLSPILFSVTEMELFFDFKPDELSIINPEGFIQYHDEEDQDSTTYYSRDYRKGSSGKYRKSIVDIYNRREYLMKVNKISHQRIFSNPYFIRLEFRFVSSNFNYLNLANLEGNYEDVARRHMDHMAMFYNRYVNGNVNICANHEEHPLFNELFVRAYNGIRKTWSTPLIKKNNIGSCFSAKNKTIEARLLRAKMSLGN
jgi:hypothetical protein